MTMKKKTEAFSSPKAKRAEIEEVLSIAQKLTDAGYGEIFFTLENEETERKDFGNEE